MAACGNFGQNGIPAAPAPTAKVASVTLAVADPVATITATATNGSGLSGETYVLDGTYNNGQVTWLLDTATSTCDEVGYCK